MIDIDLKADLYQKEIQLFPSSLETDLLRENPDNYP